MINIKCKLKVHMCVFYETDCLETYSITLTFSVIFDKITLKSCTIGIPYCFTIAVSINNLQKTFGCDLPILL